MSIRRRLYGWIKVSRRFSSRLCGYRAVASLQGTKQLRNVSTFLEVGQRLICTLILIGMLVPK